MQRCPYFTLEHSVGSWKSLLVSCSFQVKVCNHSQVPARGMFLTTQQRDKRRKCHCYVIQFCFVKNKWLFCLATALRGEP